MEGSSLLSHRPYESIENIEAGTVVMYLDEGLYMVLERRQAIFLNYPEDKTPCVELMCGEILGIENGTQVDILRGEFSEFGREESDYYNNSKGTTKRAAGM